MSKLLLADAEGLLVDPLQQDRAIDSTTALYTEWIRSPKAHAHQMTTGQSSHALSVLAYKAAGFVEVSLEASAC